MLLYNHNKHIISTCKKNGIKYYDTAVNRVDMFNTILKEISPELNDQIPFKKIFIPL